MHGYGEIIYANGKSYKGYFENDQKSGYGEMIYPDKKIYKGYWKNNKYDGEGQVILPDGRIGKAIWQNDSLYLNGYIITQVITPLICLFFVYLIKKLAESQFGSTFTFDYPFLFNIPSLYQMYPYMKNITCLEWYEYAFDTNSTQQTKDFIGYNSGQKNEIPKGMLANIQQSKNDCQFQPSKETPSQNRSVPFFTQPINQTINEDIYNSLFYLNNVPYKRGSDLESLDILPDGAIQFSEASKDKLKYKIQINDLRIPEYHRNNGVTKLTKRGKIIRNDENEHSIIFRMGIKLDWNFIFFQVFLSKARSATIIGYLLSIWTSLISVTINAAVYPDPYELPYLMRLYPPLGFSRLMYNFSFACSNGQCFRHFESLTEEIKDCIFYLYIGFFFFTFAGIYLHEVFPQEFGITQHWLFCLKKFKRKRNQILEQKESNQNILEVELQEDQDSKKERMFVQSIHFEDLKKYPLVIKDLRKVYKPVGGRPEHVAVKNLSFCIKQGEIFGLLGPNGAGKTTLISMITGIYPPSKGNAWVAGYDIINNMEYVHLNIGVCPQFDLLWPDLTVEEHLLFYARLKGIKPSQEKEKVQKAMKEVLLSERANFKISELSGGMKRRLSVSISLVGDPKIIFLDEPSTGLDPENRRQLWEILAQCKGKRAMVLTTHSMEEADILCNRIGIITNGSLRCIGQSVSLKNLYGGGYHLYINCHKEKYLENYLNDEEKKQINQQKLLEFIQVLLPRSKKVSEFNTNFVFQVPQDGLKISQIFEELQKKKEELRISGIYFFFYIYFQQYNLDWGISQSSLEDVFMQIVETTQ
ncbi:hypothetical protein IMG5_020170 [Ichthyophthirius multifiliis]|uniref:ABC transporter domain-containing protein n=1 Tax=Ichthyophthirius multifiliis TaxID=5932 RepID=G0QKN5_ICHMU|nr:hypothetical protein IMG5_020170 [Ichthyophthirius multifiliis]EGR34219.1 hypothetical protein IMG5_020170 [Ichthyophthirius multifiliis]|eukprot:XP_004039523.1 hypothetical protein IMG5_020170 [Ichthyophthirius multifiliis]